jgi:hypothetical protein
MAYTTINKSEDYFNTITYTGDGSQNVTGVGFQPDLVWVKSRSNTYSHQLHDAVRGATAGMLSSENNSAESSTYQFDSFDSDGFTTDNGNITGVNGNGHTQVAWNWKANGAGSSNTDGSINSTVSVNTTSGFSIVKWTGNSTSGATVGHGLGVVPKLIIVKTTARAGNWVTYHHTQGATKYIELNNSGTVGTSTAAWNDTAPTSSVFSLGSWSNTNDNGYGMIAYCFAEKSGYSKFGSYTGNGNADGTFVYTGFKPAWILVKHSGGGTASGEHWNLQDVKRSPNNPSIVMLSPNEVSAENSTTNNSIDILSNGFKVRTNDGRLNNSGASYIYMAFAEAPLVGTNNVPCTAR